MLSVSLSLLFAEVPFLERFERAAAAGFGAVEFFWPAGFRPADVVAAARDAGVEVALFNLDAGDMDAGERGLAGDPRREARYRENVPVALALAERLGCRRLNALVGHALPELGGAAQLRHAEELLRWTSGAAVVAGVDVHVEPLNRHDNGQVLIGSAAEAVALIERVGAENLRLQYDVFHGFRAGEDPAAELARRGALVGHVQIADAPGRHEPGTGVIDFGAVFAALECIGYGGDVGLEYIPATTTEAGLGAVAVCVEPLEAIHAVASSCFGRPGSKTSAGSRSAPCAVCSIIARRPRAT